jgi:hypothetical protein
MTRNLYLDDDTLEPSAEDVLVADYIGGFMNGAERQAFEQRLIDDEAFFHRTAPFLSPLAWPESWPIDIEVATRIAARRTAKRRAVRVKHVKSFVTGATTTAFWVKASAGFATAATVMVAALQLEQSSISAPPSQLFVHVVRPAPILAQVQPTVKPSRPIIASTTVPVTPTQERVPVLVDPALDSALAGMDSATVRAYFAPSAVTLPTEQGRVALSPWVFPYQMDSMPEARQSGMPQQGDGGVVKWLGAALSRVLGVFKGSPPPEKPPVPKPNLQCQSPTWTTAWKATMRPNLNCSASTWQDN